LSVHNIGQRVFAKYILGLSQGTVSELLSKPKHWSKLTEKGRESYRKMHAWASSDESIGTLKALGPRTGNKDTYFYQNGGVASAANPLSIAPKDSEAASSSSSITTDQKIAAILDEAKRQMMAQGKLVRETNTFLSIIISYLRALNCNKTLRTNI
jgi:predicted transcriptional regulator